jgi:hypothetical protein
MGSWRGVCPLAITAPRTSQRSAVITAAAHKISQRTPLRLLVRKLLISAIRAPQKEPYGGAPSFWPRSCPPQPPQVSVGGRGLEKVHDNVNAYAQERRGSACQRHDNEGLVDHNTTPQRALHTPGEPPFAPCSPSALLDPLTRSASIKYRKISLLASEFRAIHEPRAHSVLKPVNFATAHATGNTSEDWRVFFRVATTEASAFSAADHALTAM